MRSSPLFLVFLLTLLLGLQPLTTDLYLPALPFITTDLGSHVGQAQLTLSALLLAFGASQLVWGPVSDRFGRRPVLLTGLALYTMAAIGNTLAPNMEILIGWRVLQGVAMGAVTVCARALIRDLFDEPVLAAKIMSQGMSGLGVIACFATPVGALLTAWFGWRVTLLFLALFSVAALFLVALRLPETLRTPHPASLRADNLWRAWRGILTHRTFWTYSLLQASTYGGLFIFLAASSFVFLQVVGVSTTTYGMLMFFMALSYIIGTLICRRLLLRYSVSRTLMIGGGFSLCGGTAMALLAGLGQQQVLAIMLPFYIYIFGHGIIQPCAQSGVMVPFPRSAGAASALSSLVMVSVAFVLGQWLGKAMNDTTLPLAIGVWGCSLMVAFTSWFLVTRMDHGLLKAS